MKSILRLMALLGLLLVNPLLGEQEEIPKLEIAIDIEAEKERPAKVDEVFPDDVALMVNVQSFGEVAEREPGVEMRQGGAVGAPFISIRGTNYKWTQLLIDGVPVNPLGRPFLNLIPVTAVGKMELVKGPAPPQYPGNTISGIVNMTTKTGDEHPGGGLKLTFGRYDQQLYELSAGGGDKEQNYFFAFNRTHEHGWRPKALTNMNDATMKLVFTPDEQSKLTVAGSFLGGEKAGFVADGPNPAGQWAVHQRDISRPASAITYTRQLDPQSDLMIRVAPFSFSCQTEMQQWNKVERVAKPVFLLQRYALLRSEVQYNTRPTPDSIITGGVWYQEDRFRFTSLLSTSLMGNIPADKWHDYLQQWDGLFAQGTWKPREESALTLGLRYDEADPGGNQVSPFLSVHQRTDPTTGVRFAVSRSRRFPDLHELHGEGMWIGNLNLKSERGWNYQVDADKIFPQGVQGGLSLFYHNLENVIVADANNQYQNVGEARTYGVELSAQGSVRSGGRWWANYTYLDTKDKTKNRPLITELRTAPPKHSAKAGLSVVGKKGITYSGEVLFYGPRRTDVDIPTDETYPALGKKVTVPPRIGGYALFNIKVRQELEKKRAVTLSVENLLDKAHQSIVFYPGPGRWISLTLEQGF